MAAQDGTIRLAVDIGGTFTDLALDDGATRTTLKVLTTPEAPERGVMTGVRQILQDAGAAAERVGLVVHGTTLATNALIERKGACTALIVTEGFRDSVEMAYENRFEQYDINIDKPAPLVPRYLRLPVTERMNAHGEVLLPLDEATVEAALAELDRHGVESVAIGLIHAYANPTHEKRIAEMIAAARPGLSLSLSSEVCPEIREYERMSTTSANAYVQPAMARYLTELDGQLKQLGLTCPFFLMTSGGGLTLLETAVRFPIRLVESGPAGGAILASNIARELGLDRVMSFDMGGTTAKLCLIDDATPLASRSFEVARVYRFLKGSGLPVRIPVVEMVEIGAGGGSIARVDAMQRIAIGPDSAGADPGPACYGQGGTAATVTDADVVLGRILPDDFAGGAMPLDAAKASAALAASVGAPLNLADALAAFGVSEMVEENMANAARVHAVEWGKEAAGRALIAFGGAAPLHAARLADKLGIDRIVVPAGAGVGSAIGFLLAPVAYDVVRSRYLKLDEFDHAAANAVVEEMRAEAHGVVRQGAPKAELMEVLAADMRYVGQGHEIAVGLPDRPFAAADGDGLKASFEQVYEALYGRTIPDLDIEILTWTLSVQAASDRSAPVPGTASRAQAPEPIATGQVFEPTRTDFVAASIYRRADIAPGCAVSGPALIVEDQTTTVVSSAFDAGVDGLGHIVLTRRAADGTGDD